jgi:hypothetical protein
MTWSTTAYTHSRARPVHGAKVLGCGWPETSVTPILRGVYRARSLSSELESSCTMRGIKSRTPAKALMAWV